MTKEPLKSSLGLVFSQVPTPVEDKAIWKHKRLDKICSSIFVNIHFYSLKIYRLNPNTVPMDY